MRTDRASHGNAVVTAAKQRFWNIITALHDRHYGIGQEPAQPAPAEADAPAVPAAHYLIGEAGFPNYGDELIAREWVKYLAQIDPETPVVLDCMCSGPAAAYLYGLHPRVMSVDTVAQLAQNNYLDLLRETGKSEGGVPVALLAERLHAQLADAGQAPRYAAAQWAQQQDIPAVVSGVGLEPLTAGDAAYVHDVALAITAFSCRDQQSATAVDPKHDLVDLAPDDCFVNALSGVYRDDTADLPDTMLCIQSDLTDDKQAVLRHVMDVFDHWHVPQGAPIGVVECIPRDSIDTMEALRAHGYTPVLFPLQHLIDFGFPARPGQRWLSTRYHPHLLAAARGCSGSYIVVKPGYYDVKHQAVLRMGSRWTQTAIGQPIPEPGAGFADPEVRYQYRDRIRTQVAPIYG